MTANVFDCVILGDESLLIGCGDILRERGHRIRAIMSANPQIATWAKSNDITCVSDLESLRASMAEGAIDYLFSITYLSIVPTDLLAAARHGAINFHDGRLPDYAGLNTPVWALLNDERDYGITWHLMAEKVDQGDILMRVPVAIQDHDTALSLNTKCYEAALQSFPVLLDALESENVARSPQNPSAIRYFGKYKKPDAACAIRWDQDAAAITRLVRALEFGAYRNPVGAAKLLLGDTAVIVHEADNVGTAAQHAAGEVVGISEETITVAAGQGAVALRRLSQLSGASCTISDIVAHHDLKVGDRLTVIDDASAQSLGARQSDVAKHEDYWVRRLANLDGVRLPGHGGGASAPTQPSMHAEPFVVPSDAQSLLGGDPLAFMVALGAFVARMDGKTSFDVAYRDGALRALVPVDDPIFSRFVPLRFEIDLATPFADQRAQLSAAIQELTKRKTFLIDAKARHPAVAQATANGAPVLPVRINVGGITEPANAGGLTIAIDDAATECIWHYDSAAVSASAVHAAQTRFAAFLENLSRMSTASLADVPMLSADEQQTMLRDWNDTVRDYPRDRCVHQLFAQRAAQTPDAVALVFENQSLTYGALNARANRVAHQLRDMGIGPDKLVGVAVERSIDLMVAVLGVLKAGGAYVPIDPSYPHERVRLMLEDSNVPVLLTQRHLMVDLPDHAGRVLCVDADGVQADAAGDHDPDVAVQPDNLAYVIYTSGSTGRPKGVMVEHRNVVNFFAGMDDCIAHDPPGVWLAVTSLSFDISVLELFWTLARGFKIVLHGDTPQRKVAAATSGAARKRPVNFSLFYFASDQQGQGSERYRLLMDGAKFADEHGFEAVWTPERHFHDFGGLYPNPSVAGAAIAAITKNVGIRSGSCVLPLHHPIRVAEEWSLVDNLSDGRVGIGIASGWQPNDFVLRPQNHAKAKDIMFHSLEQVQRLWAGESVTFPGPKGDVDVAIMPKPVQDSLPVWITTAGNPETYRQAAQAKSFVLTHLLGQSLDQVAEKIEIYRQAWREAGHEGEGHVTLMLHTFVGDDPSFVKDIVREPMKRYLSTAMSLVKAAAWNFPTLQKKFVEKSGDELDAYFANASESDLDALLEFAFDRYYEQSGLFGTPEHCIEIAERVRAIGVDEVACLIDFGVPTDIVLEHLPHLNKVRQAIVAANDDGDTDDHSIAALIARHGVTHLQCTPSMASMLLADTATRDGLRSVKQMFVGGEAFPTPLAEDLRAAVGGDVTNMYGPTETTIWSSVHKVDDTSAAIPIGRPIANTQLYVLDESQHPVPVDVVGELYIGGDGVVRGYKDRPDLTAERFVDISVVPGETPRRLYRTGDLVRYREDGVIDFLGRADHQVKVRGYRIELGEIESVLGRHPAVRSAVVVARDDDAGGRGLVGYYVPDTGWSPTVQELRDFTAARLPEFMVPSLFVELDAFPLTPNGKVDRKALPDPMDSRPRPASVADYEPPVGEMESDIAEILCEVLGVEKMGRQDSFFDLGGHSLSAVRVAFQMRQQFGVDFPLQTLFEAPTVAALAERVETMVLEQADSDELESLLAEMEDTSDAIAVGND